MNRAWEYGLAEEQALGAQQRFSTTSSDSSAAQSASSKCAALPATYRSAAQSASSSFATTYRCDTRCFTCSQGAEHHVTVYSPQDVTVDTVVFYIPSTFRSLPPCQHLFQGHEALIFPSIESQNGTPWKNACPPWIAEMIAHCQQTYTWVATWSLFGFSRGACWGLQIAADPRLKWSKVLLVSPYILPSWYDHTRRCIANGIHQLSKRVLMVWGDLEPPSWLPCAFLRELRETARWLMIQGLGHEAVHQHILSIEFWIRLV